MNFSKLIQLTKRLLGAFTKGVVMAKADVVSAAKAKFQSDEDAAVQAYGEACYDGGLGDAPVGTGGIDQSVVDGLNAQIAELQGKFDADEAVVADLTGKLTDLQAGFDQLKVSDDALVAKEAGEAALIKGFSAAKQSLSDILAALEKVGAPDPAPIPDPAPVDPAPVDPAPVDPAA